MLESWESIATLLVRELSFQILKENAVYIGNLKGWLHFLLPLQHHVVFLATVDRTMGLPRAKLNLTVDSGFRRALAKQKGINDSPQTRRCQIVDALHKSYLQFKQNLSAAASFKKFSSILAAAPSFKNGMPQRFG